MNIIRTDFSKRENHWHDNHERTNTPESIGIDLSSRIAMEMTSGRHGEPTTTTLSNPVAEQRPVQHEHVAGLGLLDYCGAAKEVERGDQYGKEVIEITEGMERNDDKDTLLTGCTDGILQEAGVKQLQEILFPITPRKSMSAESYLSSTFLKKINQREGDEGDDEDKLSAYLKGRDAKELFSKNFTLEQVGQLPRWPTECQVIDERVRHIPFKPCPLEPYYTSTGNEVQPKPVGEESGIVVYQYYPISAVNYFCRSSIGGSKFLLPTCPTPEVESLRFESRFESGNLAKAIKITANYYELYLRTDLYTNRHMQWYYFRITNMKKSFLYRFSIVNFTKEDSLYGDGMRPLMYSVKDAQIHSIGWRRCGTNITYFSNETTAPDDQDQIQYYTLSFTIEFPHDDDTVYFAHSYPYTYSDLQDYLLDLVSHPVKSTYTTLRLLCKTLAGNNVYYVTVTSPPNPESTKKKKAIVVTARVHPGESPSSWMMHGFLDFLTSESGPAKDLRDSFVFKLVPMLNPDGVIVGNNRCSLTGKDLNRQYRTVIRETYPSIWYTKLLIRRLVEDCGVAMYCDLHAHSRKHNIFMFGCENKRNLERRLYEQVFPLMLHKNASEKFSFESCKFRIQKCKEGTGRVVMWMMGIGNSFTMEASFGGSMLGSRSQTHFNTLDYELMGKTFCQTLLDFYDEDPRKERLRMKIMNRLAKEGSNADEPANIRLSDYSSDGGDTTSSSEDESDRKRFNAVPETAPPPPTPVKTKRPSGNKKANTAKAQRKPLQMCKSNLTFGGGQQKSFYSTDYTTESDSDPSEPRRARQAKPSRRKKKKKAKKKPLKKVAVVDISDNEAQLPRNYTLVELYNESSKLEQKLAMKSHCRTAMDAKRLDNYQRLLEVQTKLLSLKNKLWFGVGDIDLHTPLSWGSHNMVSEAKVVVKRSEKRKSAKKTQKPKEETKEKTIKRTKESLRRQTAVDIQVPTKPAPKLRKSKSLTENLKKDPRLNRTNLYKTINIGYGQEDADQNVGGPSPTKGVTVKVKKLKKSKAAKSSNKHS